MLSILIAYFFIYFVSFVYFYAIIIIKWGVNMDIKEKIKEAGYTQKDFAEEVLGVKRLALYRKLKGEVKFTKLEKEKIKETLGIDLDK